MKNFFVRLLVLVKGNLFTIDYLNVDYSQCNMLLCVATKWNGCEDRHLILAGNNWKRRNYLEFFALITNLNQKFNQGTGVLFLSMNV